MTSYPKHLRWKIAVRNRETARTAVVDYERRLVQDRNAWIAVACLDGGIALGCAAIPGSLAGYSAGIHYSLLMIVVAVIAAQMAVHADRRARRRADAIHSRALAADLAEGGDVPLARAA